jgi:cobalt-zinc-cadmium resistance protein CzcA
VLSKTDQEPAYADRVPVAVVIISFLLFTTFTSVRNAALILMALPFAMIGGHVTSMFMTLLMLLAL